MLEEELLEFEPLDDVFKLPPVTEVDVFWASVVARSKKAIIICSASRLLLLWLR